MGPYPDAVEVGSVGALGREHRARLGAPDLIQGFLVNKDTHRP